MQKLKWKWSLLIVIVSFWGFLGNGFALQLAPSIGLGVEYTDNSRLTSNNEEDDFIVSGNLGAAIKEDGGPVSVNASTSLTYKNYTDNTFGDKYYFNLSGEAGWEIIKDYVTWEVEDYFSQQLVDSIEGGTPGNLQNVNVFTTGPVITLPLSARHSFNINPRFSKYYFEDSADSRQLSLFGGWQYKWYPQTNVSLNAGVNKIKYDNDEDNPDFTSTNLHAVFSGKQARTTYSLGLGTTRVNRDRFDDQNGFTGNLEILVDLTSRSSFDLYTAEELRDSGAGLLNSQRNSIRGNFNNEQVTSDVLNNRIIRLAYNRQGSTLRTRLWGELRNEDYKEALRDRDVTEIGVDLDYQMTALLSAGIAGAYIKKDETDINRNDKDYSVGGNIKYRLSRNLRTDFSINYRQKDSNISTAEFEEMSIFVGLSYGSGRIK